MKHAEVIAIVAITSCSTNTLLPDGGMDGAADVGACDANTSSDPNNCGSCGHVCEAGVCNAGSCASSSCQAPLTSCGSTCVDTQKDALNCGTCAHSCQTGSCTAGVCQPIVLVAGQTGHSASAIAVDSSFIYWGWYAPPNAGISQIPKAGGMPRTIIGSLPGEAPHALTTDGVTIYFVLLGAGTVGSIPVSADGGIAFTPLYTGQSYPFDLRMDATNLYWTNAGLAMNSGSVNQAPRSGLGPVVSLATSQAGPNGMSMDSTSVYWANSSASSGSIDKATIGSPNSGSVVKPLSFAGYGIITNSTRAFYSTTGADGGELDSVALDGGDPKSLLVGPQARWFFAIDPDAIYFTCTDGTVNDITLDAGARTVLANQGHPLAIAIDSTTVYWVDGQNGAVMKVAK